MQLRLNSLLLLIVFCALAATAQAQVQMQTRPPAPTPGPPRRDAATMPSPFGSPHDEMLERAAIKYDEQEHKESLERAKEGARLGVELRSDYERNKTMSREDLKKLERLEKIARSIRKRAGGSDGEQGLENPPRNLETALPRLATLAEELNKNVSKTSRHVVSTAVIDRSNELIELVRLVRTFIQK